MAVVQFLNCLGVGDFCELTGNADLAAVVFGSWVVIVAAEAGEHFETTGNFRVNNRFGDGEGALVVTKGFELLDTKGHVFAVGGGESSAIGALVREQTDGHAFFQHFRHGLGGDLDIAEDEDMVELMIGKIHENFVVFFDEEAVAGFTENTALLGEVEKGHGRGSFIGLVGGRRGCGYALESEGHGGAVGSTLVFGAEARGNGAGHEDDVGGFLVGFPGGPDVVAVEVGSEEMEAFLEAGDAGFFEGEGEVESGEDFAGAEECGFGLGAGFGEDDEVVGVADEFFAGGFEFAIEVFEEVVGEEGGDGRALGDAFGHGVGEVAVPPLAADPFTYKAEEAGVFDAGLFFEAGEKNSWETSSIKE